jgi:hypothetical protein
VQDASSRRQIRYGGRVSAGGVKTRVISSSRLFSTGANRARQIASRGLIPS